MAITVTLKVASVATSEQTEMSSVALIAEGLRRSQKNAPDVVTTLELRAPDSPDAWCGPAHVSLTLEGSQAAAFTPGQSVRVDISPQEDTP